MESPPQFNSLRTGVTMHHVYSMFSKRAKKESEKRGASKMAEDKGFRARLVWPSDHLIKDLTKMAECEQQ